MRPARKRQLVDELRSVWKVSIAPCVFDAEGRSGHSIVYKSRRGEQADLKARIKEIAETRMRYGYRRIHVLLRREGWVVNAKRIYRLYKEIGLQLRNKTPKRRVKAKLREDRSAAVTAQRDLGDGLRSRSACDRPQDPDADHRRHLLALLARRSTPRFTYRGEDVVQTSGTGLP